VSIRGRIQNKNTLSVYTSLYASANIIRVTKSRNMRWAGRVARMRKIRNAINILIGKPEGKRPLGRPRCRREGVN
jgi:hypothetical protein